MGDMSPLGRFILTAMLWGVRFAAGALAAIFALVVWHPASRLAALRRIVSCLGAKQDALQSFSDGGLSQCTMSTLLKACPSTTSAT
jgi:hypothetical protein